LLYLGLKAKYTYYLDWNSIGFENFINMAFRQVFGRCLLVTVCIVFGINKFVNSAPFERKLTESYTRIHGKLSETSFILPLDPSIVASYSYELIILTGFLLILGSTLVIFNFKLGKWIISLLFLAFNIFIHNPVLFVNRGDLIINIHMILLNFVIVAGLLISYSNKKEKNKLKDD